MSIMTVNEIIDQITRYDYWPEDLLSDAYARVIERVLTVTERQILELKVEGKSWPYLERLFGISDVSLRKHKSMILSKLENNMSKRVDNFEYYKLRTGRKKRYGE